MTKLAFYFSIKIKFNAQRIFQKYSKLKIEQVLENPANRNFVRRSILTKGTIIKTSKGNARIVSRPGQEGVINAILVK